jgi:hypothetical protein
MIRGLLGANGIECSLRTTDLSWGAFTGGGGFAPGGPIELLVVDKDVVAASGSCPRTEPFGSDVTALGWASVPE